MEFVTAFKDFGFAALVTGALLWLFATKLEKIVIANEKNMVALNQLLTDIEAVKEDLKYLRQEITALRENTRPKGRAS